MGIGEQLVVKNVRLKTLYRVLHHLHGAFKARGLFKLINGPLLNFISVVGICLVIGQLVTIYKTGIC